MYRVLFFLRAKISSLLLFSTFLAANVISLTTHYFVLISNHSKHYIMRFPPFISLLLYLVLCDDISITAQLFDDIETDNYDLFGPSDFVDQPIDPLANSDISSSLLSESDFLADTPSLGCSSFDTQNQFIGKRLDAGSEKGPQMCLPERTNQANYPGFNPKSDIVEQIVVYGPEDEEFCPLKDGLPTFLICDSGKKADRGWNPFTKTWQLNRCDHSTALIPPSLVVFWVVSLQQGIIFPSTTYLKDRERIANEVVVTRFGLVTCVEPKIAWCCVDFYIGLPPLVSGTLLTFG